MVKEEAYRQSAKGLVFQADRHGGAATKGAATATAAAKRTGSDAQDRYVSIRNLLAVGATATTVVEHPEPEQYSQLMGGLVVRQSGRIDRQYRTSAHGRRGRAIPHRSRSG